MTAHRVLREAVSQHDRSVNRPYYLECRDHTGMPREPIPAVGVPLYADARLYGEHGVPIVMYGAGPRTIGESNAKRPDENLLLEELRRATHVVASAVHDLLQK